MIVMDRGDTAFKLLCSALVFLKSFGLVMNLRSGDEQQFEGLDLVEHGEKGYHELA